jgi:hypothetical protein
LNDRVNSAEFFPGNNDARSRISLTMKSGIAGEAAWRQLRFVAATKSAAMEMIRSFGFLRFGECSGSSCTRGSSFAESVKSCLL